MFQVQEGLPLEKSAFCGPRCYKTNSEGGTLIMNLSRSFFFHLLVAAAVFAPALLCAQREDQAAKPNAPAARVSPEDLHRALAPNVKELNIDENRVRNHVMRPP